MKKNVIVFLSVVVLGAATLSVLLFGGGLQAYFGFGEEAASDEVFWCPMHPQYKVKKYGICPY